MIEAPARPAPRTDRASCTVAAPPETVYRAFVDPAMLVRWLPPEGMTGRVDVFEPRPGGAFRITLTYDDGAHATPGKTSEHADVVDGRFVELVAGKRIVQRVVFDSPDPALAGEMTVTWTLRAVPGGTEVAVVCEDVPLGIEEKDHDAGLRSSLANLAGLVERRSDTGNAEEEAPAMSEAPAIVSREEWIRARKELLALEKDHMRKGDEIAARRRALPRVRIEKEYVFETERGRRTLAELFDGRSQLLVHHLMYAPEWNAACPGCSFQAEHIDGPDRHLGHHDVRITAVSRAPIDKILAYRERMGWQFEWVSSFGSDFNYDFHVSFTKEQLAAGRIDYNFGTIDTDPRYVSEELPGVSVLFKDAAGRVFHTYSTYARGLDMLLGANHYLDLTPEGRNNAAYPDWPRRHDEYEAAPRKTA